MRLLYHEIQPTPLRLTQQANVPGSDSVVPDGLAVIEPALAVPTAVAVKKTVPGSGGTEPVTGTTGTAPVAV